MPTEIARMGRSTLGSDEGSESTARRIGDILPLVLDRYGIGPADILEEVPSEWTAVCEVCC